MKLVVIVSNAKALDNYVMKLSVKTNLTVRERVRAPLDDRPQTN